MPNPNPPQVPPAPEITSLDPTKVIAAINSDVPFRIIGNNLSEDYDVCASYNGNQINGITINVDKNSENSATRLNAIVTPTGDTPLARRNTVLQVSIKQAGVIVSSKGILYVLD